MNPLKKPSALLSLLVLCVTVLVAIVPPVRGDESRQAEELPLKSYLPFVDFSTNTPPPLFGVQTYGNTTPGAVYTPFLLDTDASWVRTALYWDSVEPVNTVPENFDWSTIDSVLAIALRDSPSVIATIDHAPEWAAEKIRGPIYPDKLPEFAQFMRALVERYDGDGFQDAPGNPVVRHWEIYNEPDASYEKLTVGGWGEYGAEYAQMLSVVYPAVKQASNKAQVLFGGIAFDWWTSEQGFFVQSFFDDVLAAGGGAYFDIMNFHTYPGFWRRWTDDGSSGLSEKAQVIRAKLENYHLEKPLFITETGWHSTNEPSQPSSPEEQARYVVELFVEGMATDIDVMIWWMLYDPGDFFANGLITSTSPPTIKPSFTAYKALVARLGRAEFVRRLATPAPVFNPDGSVQSMDAYEFNDSVNRRTIYVAWMNPVDGNTAWQLRLPGAQGTRSNSYNTESIPVSDADDGVIDGFITLTVGSHPVFIEVPW